MFLGVPHVPPPAAVTTAEAKPMEWHPYLKSIGTLAPVEGATLSADADGIVRASRPTAHGGEGRLIADRARRHRRAGADGRGRAQADPPGLILSAPRTLGAKEQFPSPTWTWPTPPQAECGNAAACRPDAKKQVRAPFDGRVGIRLVNVGQFVPRQGHRPLQKLDPST